MKKKQNVIYPKIGFGSLYFGMRPDDVVKIKGLPEQVENEDDDGDIIYRYDTQGIDLLCFEKEEEYKLTIIELNIKSNAYMWNTEIFKASIETLKGLSKINECVLIKIPSDLPQVIYRLKSLSIDFYFNNSEKLENVSMGVFVDESDQVVWPNQLAAHD